MTKENQKKLRINAIIPCIERLFMVFNDFVVYKSTDLPRLQCNELYFSEY